MRLGFKNKNLIYNNSSIATLNVILSTMLTDSKQQQFLQELFELLRIRSISTLPEHKEDMMKAVEWLREYLKSSGLGDIQELYADNLDKEKHHPVLFAQRIDDPNSPTLMIYGHYDVQPVDPIDQWDTDPFEPEVINSNIYARGATDDKGQMFTHLAALKELSDKWGNKWPLNVKILLEGEEENGGENIEELILQHKDTDLLKADVCVISDSSFVAPGIPAIEYGLRGITYMQINVKLSDRDLHSGLYGGGVLNPATALVHILSQLRDHSSGKVSIPGFYEKVVDVSDTEREKLSKVPYDEKSFLEEAGNAKSIYGEDGYTTVERTSARPTLEINGIWSGFTGEGAKTIIPATAHAKISMRLVANQDPAEIAEIFTSYIESIAPKEVDVEVQLLHKGDGVLIDLDSEYIKIAGDVLKNIFGNEVIFSRSGGSIPVVALLHKHLNMPVVLIGYGLPDDNLHSPNEKFSLDNFYKGIECNIELYESLSKK